MKKFCTIIGIILLIFALTGCIDEKQDDIQIGALLPLTGDGALYGQMAKKAIDLAVEEINTEGGINGKKLSVIYEDTQINPNLATSGATKLITVDKVPAIIGTMASNTFLPVIPIVQKNKVVIISPSATSSEITKAGDYIFRTIVSDIYDGKAMAQFAYNEMEFRNVSVFYVDEAGPRGVSIAFMEEFEKLGGQVLAEEKGYQEGTDFRTQITKIIDTNPDAVYFAGYAKETVTFLTQAKESGLNKQLMTHQLIEDPDVINRSRGSAEGVIFTSPKLILETSGQDVKDFYDKFKNKYGEEPHNFAPNSYDAVMLVSNAMKKYGTDPENFKQGLYEVEGYQGASGEITIDENGDIDQAMQIMVIKDGKTELYIN